MTSVFLFEKRTQRLLPTYPSSGIGCRGIGTSGRGSILLAITFFNRPGTGNCFRTGVNLFGIGTFGLDGLVPLLGSGFSLSSSELLLEVVYLRLAKAIKSSTAV